MDKVDGDGIWTCHDDCINSRLGIRRNQCLKARGGPTYVVYLILVQLLILEEAATNRAAE